MGWAGGLTPTRQGWRGASCKSVSIDHPPHPILVFQSPKFPFFFQVR